ncbi:nucleoside deaminase [Paramuribaculum intestinale]|uniref:nucleoside deaminase n=1 Tax=Paramuribaculum intestinale TaxID=2094151 RepID=UPI0025A99211|nr:nucleoside deaminase [Paramuribaculum intestinale]
MNNTTAINDDERYMRMALDEAHRALEEDEVPIGAVVICKGTVVGRGHNLTEALSDVTAHAEMQAITAAAQTLGGKYLTDCTLYVTVEPCVMCAGAIGWSQLPRIVYGAADPKRGYSRLGGNPFHPKATVKAGVLADECSALMKEFFAGKR